MLKATSFAIDGDWRAEWRQNHSPPMETKCKMVWRLVWCMGVTIATCRNTKLVLRMWPSTLPQIPWTFVYFLTPLDTHLPNWSADVQPFSPTPVSIYTITTPYYHAPNPVTWASWYIGCLFNSLLRLASRPLPLPSLEEDHQTPCLHTHNPVCDIATVCSLHALWHKWPAWEIYRTCCLHVCACQWCPQTLGK